MEYLNKMKEIQTCILEFLDEEGDEEEPKFSDIQSLLNP